jgi:hypothetical protein
VRFYQNKTSCPSDFSEVFHITMIDTHHPERTNLIFYVPLLEFLDDSVQEYTWEVTSIHNEPDSAI